jgi:hypothetical protein
MVKDELAAKLIELAEFIAIVATVPEATVKVEPDANVNAAPERRLRAPVDLTVITLAKSSICPALLSNVNVIFVSTAFI